jgi:phosphomannomutase
LSEKNIEILTVTEEFINKYNTMTFIGAAEEYKTAGIRGAIGKTLEEGVINAGNVRLYAQARSDYIKKHYPPAQQTVFIGRDERLFALELSLELARVYAGNGIGAYVAESSTPCPVTSYTGWINGISGDLVSASHNRGTKELYYNGIKPNSDTGGLVSEDETNEIIEKMKSICAASGTISVAPFDHPLIRTIDPLPAYIDHLRNNLSRNDLEAIRMSGARGLLKTCWATHGGAAGPSLERINEALLGKDWDKYIFRLHWDPDPYFHGYGANPDPSDPVALKNLLLREGVLEKLINGEVSYAQATDGDGDRVGLLSSCPGHLTQKALQAGLLVYNAEGDAYSDDDYSKGRAGAVYMLPYQLFVLLTYLRSVRLQQVSNQGPKSYVIVTSHATPYFERIADNFNCTLVRVPVGFKWLNLAASQIEAGQEDIEVAEVHWRDQVEIIHHHVGKNKQIMVICEESGGINVGNINEEINKIGQKSKIAKEKDGLKAFFIVQLEASRLALEGKTLVDVYMDILNQPGFGNSYYKRTDLSLISKSGSSVKEAFMDFYTGLYQQYKDSPADLVMEGVKAKQIFSAGDGVKVIMENGSWLYVRPSGTEPKLKIFVWGNTKDDMEKLENTINGYKDKLLV